MKITLCWLFRWWKY